MSTILPILLALVAGSPAVADEEPAGTTQSNSEVRKKETTRSSSGTQEAEKEKPKKKPKAKPKPQPKPKPAPRLSRAEWLKLLPSNAELKKLVPGLDRRELIALIDEALATGKSSKVLVRQIGSRTLPKGTPAEVQKALETELAKLGQSELGKVLRRALGDGIPESGRRIEYIEDGKGNRIPVVVDVQVVKREGKGTARKGTGATDEADRKKPRASGDKTPPSLPKPPTTKPKPATKPTPATAPPAPAKPKPNPLLDPKTGKLRLSPKERRLPRITLFGRDEDTPQAYYRASYNFMYDTRDDHKLTLNNWDLLVEAWNGDLEFDVNTMTDDRSSIVDLGVVDIGKARVTAKARKTPMTMEGIPVQVGHTYLIHNRDTDWDYWTRIRVIGLGPDHRVDLIWEMIRDDSKPREGLPPVPKKNRKRR